MLSLQKLFLVERGARYALIKLSQEKRAKGVISTSGTVYVLLVDFDTISRDQSICIYQSVSNSRSFKLATMRRRWLITDATLEFR